MGDNAHRNPIHILGRRRMECKDSNDSSVDAMGFVLDLHTSNPDKEVENPSAPSTLSTTGNFNKDQQSSSNNRNDASYSSGATDSHGRTSFQLASSSSTSTERSRNVIATFKRLSYAWRRKKKINIIPYILTDYTLRYYAYSLPGSDHSSFMFFTDLCNIISSFEQEGILLQRLRIISKWLASLSSHDLNVKDEPLRTSKTVYRSSGRYLFLLELKAQEPSLMTSILVRPRILWQCNIIVSYRGKDVLDLMSPQLAPDTPASEIREEIDETRNSCDTDVRNEEPFDAEEEMKDNEDVKDINEKSSLLSK
jgi:hypothetical protein